MQIIGLVEVAVHSVSHKCAKALGRILCEHRVKSARRAYTYSVNNHRLNAVSLLKQLYPLDSVAALGKSRGHVFTLTLSVSALIYAKHVVAVVRVGLCVVIAVDEIVGAPGDNDDRAIVPEIVILAVKLKSVLRDSLDLGHTVSVLLCPLHALVVHPAGLFVGVIPLSVPALFVLSHHSAKINYIRRKSEQRVEKQKIYADKYNERDKHRVKRLIIENA